MAEHVHNPEENQTGYRNFGFYVMDSNNHVLDQVAKETRRHQMNTSSMYAPPLPARVKPKTAPQTFRSFAATTTSFHIPRVWRKDMEFLCEETDYNVAEFYEQFYNNLPKTVMVNEGFCGEIIEDIFDRGQILRINAISSQRRVIAKFQYLSASRLISIPESYDEKLCVVKRSGKCGKPQDIYKILKESMLPLIVQFPKDQTITVGNQTISSNNIPSIELQQIFDEVYLLGNFISQGSMIEGVVPVPLYLSQLRLTLVTGIKGQSKEKWKEYQEEWNRAASYIEYDQQFGNRNIAEYDPSANHSDKTYTYVEPRLYSNIVKLVHKAPSRSFQNTTYNPELHHLEDDPCVYEEIDKTAVDKATSGAHEDGGKRAPHKEEFEAVFKSERRHAGESKTMKSQLPSSILQVNKTSSLPTTASKPNLNSKPRSAVDLYMETVHEANRPVSIQLPNAKSRDDNTALYTNDIPRSKISPSVQVGQKSGGVRNREIENAARKLNSPGEVNKLTIDEVAVYLRKLKLEKYIGNFQQQLIDGRILVELDKDVLKEEFHMTAIEALRLMSFAKDGHVPT